MVTRKRNNMTNINKDELFIEWDKEMESRHGESLPLPFYYPMRLAYWSFFQQYRIIYFMQICCDGMATIFAWKYANKLKKEKIMNYLNTK